MSTSEIIKKPIEKISSNIKMSAWASVLESLAILIVGILFVAWPEIMINATAYIVGIFFLAKGAFQIISYFVEHGQRDFFNNGLLGGTVSGLVGIAVLIAGPNIANVFRIVVGVFLIYDSLIRINTALKLHAAGIKAWSYVLIVALVVLILGVVVALSDVATVIGWMMIIAGAIGIVGDIIFIQYVNQVVDFLTGKTSADKNSARARTAHFHEAETTQRADKKDN